LKGLLPQFLQMLAAGAPYSQYSTPWTAVHVTVTPASPGSTFRPPTGGEADWPLPPQAAKRAAAASMARMGLNESNDI
jgi:hypothetical protein